MKNVPKDYLRKLVRQQAIEQALEADASRTTAQVLGYLGLNMDFKTKTVRVRQILIAERLGISVRMAQKAVAWLRVNGLLVDQNAGLRNRAHTYMLLLDWSFSENLVPPAETVLKQPAMYPGKPKKLGYDMDNRKAGECSICHVHVPTMQGKLVLYPGRYCTFCIKHVSVGKLGAASGWDGHRWPSVEDAEAFGLKALRHLTEETRRRY
jgi:hypothetical protein